MHADLSFFQSPSLTRTCWPSLFSSSLRHDNLTPCCFDSPDNTVSAVRLLNCCCGIPVRGIRLKLVTQSTSDNDRPARTAARTDQFWWCSCQWHPVHLRRTFGNCTLVFHRRAIGSVLVAESEPAYPMESIAIGPENARIGHAATPGICHSDWWFHSPAMRKATSMICIHKRKSVGMTWLPNAGLILHRYLNLGPP